MKSMITKFRIIGLFNQKNYEILIDQNKLILVAENGSGKTTIVNLFFYFLSKQWSKLTKYKFNKIQVVIGNTTIELSRDELDYSSTDTFKRYLKRYPKHIQIRIEEVLNNFDFTDSRRNESELVYLSNRYDLPYELLNEFKDQFYRRQKTLFTSALQDKLTLLQNSFKSQILFMPTYRRIEQDLKNIFPDLEVEIDEYRHRKRYKREVQNANFIELVEFGMEDVTSKIDDKLIFLKENLNSKLKNDLTGAYLRDVINKNYLKITYDTFHEIDEKVLENILDRIDESVLAKSEKLRLIDFVKGINDKSLLESAENQILAYFIYRLSIVYNELKEEEKPIVDFVEKCNNYASNKKLYYDNKNFNIKIHPLTKNGELNYSEEIFFKDLSSGEKQIVSLFSHIYLTDRNSYFIIIDEPELSLSVEWQKKLLTDIVDNNTCNGLLAVTHSPFIFDNKLETYAHGLNEFEVVKS